MPGQKSNVSSQVNGLVEQANGRMGLHTALGFELLHLLSGAGFNLSFLRNWLWSCAGRQDPDASTPLYPSCLSSKLSGSRSCLMGEHGSGLTVVGKHGPQLPWKANSPFPLTGSGMGCSIWLKRGVLGWHGIAVGSTASLGPAWHPRADPCGNCPSTQDWVQEWDAVVNCGACRVISCK